MPPFQNLRLIVEAPGINCGWYCVGVFFAWLKQNLIFAVPTTHDQQWQ